MVCKSTATGVSPGVLHVFSLKGLGWLPVWVSGRVERFTEYKYLGQKQVKFAGVNGGYAGLWFPEWKKLLRSSTE